MTAGSGATADVAGLVRRVHAALAATGATVAVAESLTGGLVAAALTDPPGASATFRGGVVVYATDLKHVLADVPLPMLEDPGPVSAPVATALAAGVRTRLGATYGLSSTGVAGPTAQDGQDQVPVGTVYLGLAGPPPAASGSSRSSEPTVTVRRLALSGDRAQIRTAAVVGALELLASALGECAH